MGVQADVKTALDGSRADLIRALAEHRLLPTVVEQGGSDLLGESSAPTIALQPDADGAGSVDRQTTVLIVDELELDSEADCESVREEIRAHEAWA